MLSVFCFLLFQFYILEPANSYIILLATILPLFAKIFMLHDWVFTVMKTVFIDTAAAGKLVLQAIKFAT